jgi:predicted metalloendopeptidase
MPKQRFFRYVNGTWLDNTAIPADRTRWGIDEFKEQMLMRLL